MPKLKKHNSHIWTISDFWNKTICNTIISELETSGLFPTHVEIDKVDDNLDDNLVSRNNSRINFISLELAFDIWKAIEYFLKKNNPIKNPVGINESFRFYKYERGQEFKKHKDCSFIRNKNERSSYSLLIYLNDDFEGGETVFNKISLVPKIGTAVFFPHTLEHSSNKLLDGLKYILRTDIMCKT